MTKKENTGEKGTITGRAKSKDTVVVLVDEASSADTTHITVKCDVKMFETLKQDFRLARVNHYHDVESIKAFAKHTNLPEEVAEDILSGKVYACIGAKDNTIMYGPIRTK